MSTDEQQATRPPGAFPSDQSFGEFEDISQPGLDLQSLTRAMKSRKADYIRRQSVSVKVGTWNVAAIPGTENDIGRWFVQGEGASEAFSGSKDPQSRGHIVTGQSTSKLDSEHQNGSEGTKTASGPSPEAVDLYVLGLQEIVDISSPAEALRPYTDQGPARRWKEAVHQALPAGYELVSEVQLLGLYLTIYASPELRDSISSVSSTSVGTGLMGYMGNKGAVATRIVIGETTRLVFVNCHLAAGSDKGSLERRNWDAAQIIQRTKFELAESEDGQKERRSENIGEEDFAFWFGDLNYRLDDIPGDDVRQVLARHAENGYDSALQSKLSRSNSRRNSHASDSAADSQSSPSSVAGEDENPDPVADEDIDPHNDPASLQTTISSLMTHDQLRTQQRKGTAFHKGWREGEITFLPTYKYDVGSVARFDSSEKHRGPSWCDRILFRTQQDINKHEQMDREAEDARKRDKEMQDRGLDKAVADYNVLFDYDPEVDGSVDGDGYESDADGAGDNTTSPVQEESEPDPIHQHHYGSYQGILSSDHKPLSANFTLTFDAVDSRLKANVHQEVVRELDKAENEARPGLTVVVDTHIDEKGSKHDPNTVSFGEVKFDVPVHRSLTVANTSGAPAKFSFAEQVGHDNKSDDSASWLDVHIHHSTDAEPTLGVSSNPHNSHTLHPGEVAHIDVTAHVRSIEHVRQLNKHKAELEEILVLHVDSGRDHFIPVCGKWMPTCFGCSVEELTRMPEQGARSQLRDSEIRNDKETEEVRLSAPRELFRLTECISDLAERAVAEWSMMKGESEEEQPPWSKEPAGFAWPFQPETWTLTDPHTRASLLTSVRESLDTNESFSSAFTPEISSLHRLEVMAETLLSFLNSIEDGIVTASVWHQMEQQIISRERSKAPSLSWEETQAWVLESLAYSPAHSVSFTFVTFMLARLANEIAPVPSAARSDAFLRRTKTSSEESTPTSASRDSRQRSSSHSSSSFGIQAPSATAKALVSGGSLRLKSRFVDAEPESTALAEAASRREAVETALAEVFSKVLISSDVPHPSKDKDRRASDERKRSIIEPFLKMVGVDERGPSGGR
ncbi:Uncharacterized protein PECH_008437 [Penicillium ucsense]|uniref:Inositol polyphosphate-related phosphatase domain-containing protein n=1 Tax=Penicillium ucsense TaxID=2839758 RepID=A0A8J8W458_9EURO|nr:Uncharacterized protein PECM_003683 [Penicillium ucsense]KAF7734124.1 Uncharacterized protein PECH_008437 [Penicillium ucsense]